MRVQNDSVNAVPARFLFSKRQARQGGRKRPYFSYRLLSLMKRSTTGQQERRRRVRTFRRRSERSRFRLAFGFLRENAFPIRHSARAVYRHRLRPADPIDREPTVTLVYERHVVIQNDKRKKSFLFVNE